MRIVYVTPGSGDSFYCENCLRDDAAVKAMRKAGHDVTMVPLYLPPLVNEPQAERGQEMFFGGINVYLQQKFGLFRRTPRWIDRLFDSPRLLKRIAGMAGMTTARELGETTLSMLRGEQGRQVKELDRLVEWMAANDRPDVVCLSNALLIGLARRIRQRLGATIVCLLQDEDSFLDGLPPEQREPAWRTLRERTADVDVFVAASRYYAEVMEERLAISPDRVRVVYNGIDPSDYRPAERPPTVPTIGFLSRFHPDKGLDLLVEAVILLKRHAHLRELKLRAAGGRTARDEAFLRQLRRRLAEAGVERDAEFLPNLNRTERAAFLPSLSVLSVPERRGEAFGLYLLEALACGVPVVLPDNGAASELIEATGGGLLCPPNDPSALTEALGKLLLDSDYARALGRKGREAMLEKFSVERTARMLLAVCAEAVPATARRARA